jgi:plastocyanin
MNKNTVITLIVLLVVIILGAYYLTTTNNKYAQNQVQNQNPPASQVGQQSSTVTISNFTFTPHTLTVPAGTTVTWTNEDGVTHNVRSTAFSSPDMPNGASFSFKFDNPGTYDYSCGIHTGMTGTIIVNQSE